MFQVGPMVRLPKSEATYIKRLVEIKPSDGCPFCKFVTEDSEDILERVGKCVVIKNVFGYDMWDGCGVEDHIMIIPNSHVASIGEMTDQEKKDFMNILSDYEAKGYSIYARSPGNKTKSVVHQHTHLIKIDNRRKKMLFYLWKPHVLFMR